MTDTVSFQWSTRREANDGYVLEEHIDSYGDVVWSCEFGPMPCHIVLTYVNARRRITALKAQEYRASYVEPEPIDWSTLQ